MHHPPAGWKRAMTCVTAEAFGTVRRIRAEPGQEPHFSRHTLCMNKRITVAVLAALFLLPCAAIAIPHAGTPVDVDTVAKLIPAGTLVRIRMLTALSSASTKEGALFSWVVSDDIKVGDRVVIPAGNIGWGK